MLSSGRSKYIWSEENFNSSLMGRYLTEIEFNNIREALVKTDIPAKILDIGGGDGRFARRLLPLGFQPIVLERDDRPLKELIEQGWKDPVIMADGVKLPIKKNRLKAVLCIEVVECTSHNKNQDFFAEIHRILEEKGTLIFTTENTMSLIGILKRLFGGNKNHKEVNYYSESFSKIKNKLNASGFNLISAIGFRWIPFSRVSNNRLIDLFAKIEKIFNLNRLPYISPWILWVAQKKS